MSAGLQVFSSSGDLEIDISTFLGRIIGVVNTGTSSGSVNNINGFSQGTPFYVIDPTTSQVWFMPDVTLGTNSVSWEFPDEGSVECNIFYGVY